MRRGRRGFRPGLSRAEGFQASGLVCTSGLLELVHEQTTSARVRCR